MNYLSRLLKLAEEISSGLLLPAALDANKGQGINVTFKGQHFGWFVWDEKLGHHKELSIANFDNDDTIGELESTVAKLKNVKLEDYEIK